MATQAKRIRQKAAMGRRAEESTEWTKEYHSYGENWMLLKAKKAQDEAISLRNKLGINN